MELYKPKSGSAEERYYEGLLGQVNPGQQEVLDAASVGNFLRKSELPQEVLREIWNVGSMGQREITKPLFFNMVRCVALVQAKRPMSVEAVKASAHEEKLVPRFAGVDARQMMAEDSEQQKRMSTPPAGINSPMTPRGGHGGADGDASPWAIPPKIQAQYEELFAKQPTVDGKLNGKDAVVFLQQSRLDNVSLRQVWDLADVDKDGKLSLEEFSIAMHLIMNITRRKLPCPKELPPELQPKGYAPRPGLSSMPSTGSINSGDSGSNRNSGAFMEVPSPSTSPAPQQFMDNKHHSQRGGFPMQVPPSPSHVNAAAPPPPAAGLPPTPPPAAIPQQQQHQAVPPQSLLPPQQQVDPSTIASMQAANEALSGAALVMSNNAARAKELNDRSKEEMEALQKEQASLSEKIKQSVVQIEEEQAKVHNLDEELSLMKANVESLVLELQEKQGDLFAAKEQFMAKKAELQALNAQAESLRASIATTAATTTIIQGVSQDMDEQIAAAASVPPPAALEIATPTETPASTTTADMDKPKRSPPSRHAPAPTRAAPDLNVSNTPASTATSEPVAAPAATTSSPPRRRAPTRENPAPPPSRIPPPSAGSPRSATANTAPTPAAVPSSEQPGETDGAAAEISQPSTEATSEPTEQATNAPKRAAPTLAPSAEATATDTSDEPAESQAASTPFDDAFGADNDPFAAAPDSTATGESSQSNSEQHGKTKDETTAAAPSSDFDAAFGDAGFDPHFDFDSSKN